MPELVEVSLIVDFINKKFKNAIIKNVIINSGRYSRHKKPDGYDKFIEALPIKINSFHTKGKFIYIKLDQQMSIWITLGLTGELLLQPTIHSHVIFETNKGNFYFDDMRNFGTIKFAFTDQELNKKLKTLGPDPLQEDVTKTDFIKIMKKPSIQNKPIALALIDQKVIAGIGNYLRAEILYHAKINPLRKVKDLKESEIEDLWKAMNFVIAQSYKKQTNTGLHTYPFSVYRKDKTPLGEVVKHRELEGRTLWYVPSVQK